MPKFNSREEYEQWKAERLRELRGKGAAQDSQNESPSSGEVLPGRTPEPLPPEPQKLAGPEKEQAKTTLTDIGELFRISWDIYKNRFTPLITLYLLSFVFLVFPVLLFAGMGFLLSLWFPDIRTTLLLVWSIPGVVLGTIALFWGIAAFTTAVTDQKLGIRAALDEGWKRILSFVWLFSLLGYIVTGGFLLFMIPGIFFMVWFGFGQFIVVSGKERGMSALLKSKEYVKGYWFDIFLRFFLIWLASIVIGLVPFIGFILTILFTPFMMIYLWLIYSDLRAKKGDVPFLATAGEKCKWIGLATLGYIIVPFIIIALLGVTVFGSMLFLHHFLKSSALQNNPITREIIPFPDSTPLLPSEIEGTWTVRKQDEGSFQLTFSKGFFDISAVKNNQARHMRGTVLIDDKTTPKQLDLLIREATQSTYLGKTSLGIYKIEGNTLTLCANEPGDPRRPSAFTSEDKIFCVELIHHSKVSREDMKLTSPKIPLSPSGRGMPCCVFLSPRPEHFCTVVFSPEAIT